jgi:hypothetical protein
MDKFEQALKIAERHERAGDAWMVACVALDALRVLAAERAAERERAKVPLTVEVTGQGSGQVWSVKPYGAGSRVDLTPIMAPGFDPDEGATPYQRAMSPFNRMGGIHPHDGRHITSLRHWGMH